MKSIRISLQTLAVLVLVLGLVIPAWVAQAAPAPAHTWGDTSVTYTAPHSAGQPCGPCSGIAQTGHDTGSTATQSESEWESQPLQVNVQVDLTQEGDGVYSDAILSTIEEFGWRTTVFVTGEFASSYPGVVAGIEDRGHEIGVHGWEQGEDISVLSYEEQLQLIQEAFSAVRAAADRPEQVLDFKPQAYAFNADTIDALQEFGARSISGVFSIDDHESFSWCPYVQLLGKVTFPYPVTDTFFAIPISTTEVDAEELPLDDEFIHDPQTLLDSLIAGYDQQAEMKDPLVIVLRPLNTGADETKLGGLVQFLDYVQSNEGLVKPLSSMTHQTSYIPYIEIISAPESAAAGETIAITTRFTAQVYCPLRYFRIYGKYPGDAQWALHAEYSHGMSTGTHTFSRSFEVPEPTSAASPTTEDAFGYNGEYILDDEELRERERAAVPHVMKHAEGEDVSPSLIMAVIRQESNFTADANGSAWVGYMQVSHEVASRFGYTGSETEWRQQHGLDPDQNVEYGTKYLRTLNAIFRDGLALTGDLSATAVVDATERLKFVLAAYNGGEGRIARAQEICDSEGDDPERWDDVQQYLEDASADGAKAEEIRNFVPGVIEGRDVIDGQRRGYDYFLTIRVYGDFYIVRAVGQGCWSGWGACWPTADTHENRDEVVIEVEAVSRVLPAQAAELARQVIGAPYLGDGRTWGGKAEDCSQWPITGFASADEITEDGYRFYDGRIGACNTEAATGLDCSGLVYWSYNRAFFGDESLDRRGEEYGNRPLRYEGAHGQYSSNTDPISKEDLRPGDLLFFDTNASGLMDHVAMYVGGATDNVIHASGFTGTITYATYNPENEELITVRAPDESQTLSVTHYGRVTGWEVNLQINVRSPVYVSVEDPEGFVTSPEHPWTGPLEYQTESVDGALIDVLITGERRLGDYLITLSPKPGALPTETYSLEVVADGIATSLAQNVPVDEIPEEPYVYESQPPTTVHGTVTDYNGQPVPNALVQIIGPSTVTIHTDEDGYYRSVRLEPGGYAIDVAPNPYDNLMSSRISVSVSAGAVVTRNFVLNAAGSIAGTVVDAEGNPVVGARLYLSGYERPRYASNENGEYIVPGLTAGSVVLNIHAPGYDPWHIYLNSVYFGHGSSVAVEVNLDQTVWVDFTQQLAKPEIRISPELLDFRLPVGGYTTGDLTVHNDGNAPLDFEIGLDNVHWLCVDPGEGTVGPGDQTTITVTANTAGLEAGQYAESIIITSNDVDRAELYVQVSLTVYFEAVVTVDPETLNLQARGQWITAYIELPEGYVAEDVYTETVELAYGEEEPLVAAWRDIQDGVLMAKFDWGTVAGWFEGLHDEEVELTVAGEVDGVDFEGTDTIRVIDPPRRRGRG